MIIADYATLKSTVQTWAVRSDNVFSSQIPIFVSQAEERIYSGAGELGAAGYSPALRSKTMEVVGTIDMVDGVGDLPAEALAIRKLHPAASTVGVTLQTPERFDVLAANQPSTGQSKFYTIDGNKIKLLPSFTGQLDITYYQRFPEITEVNATGPLLTAHGLIYLEAVLFYAFTFLQDGALAEGHLSLLRSAIDGENKKAAGLRHPTQLRVRSGMNFNL